VDCVGLEHFLIIVQLFEEKDYRLRVAFEALNHHIDPGAQDLHLVVVKEDPAVFLQVTEVAEVMSPPEVDHPLEKVLLLRLSLLLLEDAERI